MNQRAGHGWTSRLAIVLLGAHLAFGCGGDSSTGGNGDGDGGGGGGPDGGGGCSGEFCPDGGGPPPGACKRVDLVFAVDNSSSMNEEKMALAEDVFPAFADRLLLIGGGLDDYQAGVIDACPDPSTLHTRGTGGDCNFASGEVWMNSDDPDLENEFRCVAAIDSTGTNCSGNNDDEQPASAAAAALENAKSGGTNAGFLRDDAVLVVIAITDEDEQPVPNKSAQEVYDRLVAVKGDVKKMVFLGIGGASACNDGFYGSADQATKTKQITDLFIAQERGVFWDLCEGRLEDGLDEAMQVIEKACEEIVID